MDFDETRLYYSHQQLQQQSAGNTGGENGDDEDGPDGDGAANPNAAANVTFNEDDSRVDLQAVRRHFREFLRKLLAMLLLCCFIWIGLDSFVRSFCSYISFPTLHG
jgi:hypothetical protein